MKKLSPTRGVYDLAGVEGAAGPVQFFGALACLATVIVAAVTFRHGPFSLYSVTFLLIAHGFSRTVRMRVPSVERRLALSGVMLVALLALTLAVPPLRDAAITPDMRQDRDYALGGILMWIALAGQTFASAPGVLIFLLLPELASMAVFGQLNVNVEMPASFALYLASALGLLAYANFLRRPLGAPVERSVVLPGVRDMMFSISTLFLLLALGGGFLAIVLQAIIPSAFARPWLTGYFFQSDRSSRGPTTTSLTSWTWVCLDQTCRPRRFSRSQAPIRCCCDGASTRDTPAMAGCRTRARRAVGGGRAARVWPAGRSRAVRSSAWSSTTRSSSTFL